MTRLAKHLAHQRRIRLLFLGLILYGLIVTITMVPIEKNGPEVKINTAMDSMWWAVATVTGVGYGDVIPLSTLGRILGMSLQMVGVVAFGMLVGMVTMVMSDQTNRYFYRKIFERFDNLEKQLNRLEKQSAFMIEDTTTLPPPETFQ